jgi:ribonuclease HII
MAEALICGVDEAGRGPLAGPVYAAAVVLDPYRTIQGLADSKTLSERRRSALADAIRQAALAWAVGVASVEEIDTLNILRASLLAMRRAITQLTVTPTEILVDGLHCPEVEFRTRAVVGGDATVAAISAASIVAKTERDAEMLRLHQRYPQYGFDRHKGYPTREHLEALQAHGASEVHRRSFAPVKKILTRQT